MVSSVKQSETFIGTNAMYEFYIQALRSTQQEKTVQLAPVIIRILQEMLRLSEGSFDWNVIAEPKVKDTFYDFLGAWDEPETEERTVIVKHAPLAVVLCLIYWNNALCSFP